MNKSQGLVQLIVLIIILVLILSYFHVDIRGFLDSEPTRSNLRYVAEVLGRLWHFLAGIWDTYILPLF